MPLDIELPLWTIRPNWRNGILERLSWLTDVLPSTYGPEQRRALRLSPRRAFEISFNPIDSARSYFDLFLHRLGSTEFMLPLFHDKGRISATVNNGDVVIPVDTTYREFEVGGLALMLGDDPFTYNKLEVTAVAADSITVAAPGVLQTWGKGAALYPLRRSRLSLESRFAALTSRVGDSTLEFTLNQANDIADEGAWGVLYNGYPVLTDKPNRREALDVDYIRNAMTLDNEHGIPELLDDAGRAFTLQVTSHMMRGRAEHWAFRQFLYRLKGQRDPIWLPSYNRDVELARDALAADTHINIKKIGYDYTGGAVSGRHHLLIDGSITREITDVGVPMALDEERLELNAALGAGKPAGSFASFMEPCRLSTDTVEIVHHTDTTGVAECNLSWKAFRDERTAEEPLAYPIPITAERIVPCGELEPAAGQIWRIFVSENNGGDITNLGELEFREAPGGTDLVALEFSAIKCLSGGDGADLPGGGPDEAFDHNTAQGWDRNSTGGCWIGFRFDVPVIVQEIMVQARTSGAFTPGRQMKAGTVDYSNDEGDTWTTVLEFDGLSGWSSGEIRLLSW